MRKNLLSALALITLTTGGYAQKMNQSSDKKPTLFGLHINAVDFKTPAIMKDRNSPRDYTGLRDMDYGLSASYWKGLTPTIDLGGKFNVMMHDYAGDRKEATTKTEMGLELEPTLNFRPYSDKEAVAPYLTLGVGAGVYTGKVGAYVPAGVGVQFNFNNVTYLMVQAQYRFTLTSDVLKNNLMYSIGFAQNFGPEKVKPVVVPPAPPVVLDRDNDGVLDADDKCPDVAGLANLKGCPDKDGDSIADAEDKCPTVAGLAKYQGCPIPDTDKDGVNDEQDKCPTEAGLARYQGCPIPDGDGDGVNDEDDKCPAEKGSKENKGCPVLADFAFKAENVQFLSGSVNLTKEATAELDKGAAILVEHGKLNVSINGYTDNTGKPETNLALSQKRAEAVKAYLVKKGVSAERLTATGFGIEKPLADNTTAEGRAKNRRVEFVGNN
jgi:OOP family OmpA-OmpF porin